VIIPPNLHSSWLASSTESAANLMSWQHMPPLVAEPAPVKRIE